MEQKLFQKTVIRIALPVTLQCLLQSSFSVIDQIGLRFYFLSLINAGWPVMLWITIVVAFQGLSG